MDSLDFPFLEETEEKYRVVTQRELIRIFIWVRLVLSLIECCKQWECLEGKENWETQWTMELVSASRRQGAVGELLGNEAYTGEARPSLREAGVLGAG